MFGEDRKNIPSVDNFKLKNTILDNLSRDQLYKIKVAIDKNKNSLSIRIILLGIILLFTVLNSFIFNSEYSLILGSIGIKNVSLFYIVVNFLLLIISIFISIKVFISGFTSLIKLSINSDSIISFTSLVCVVQIIWSYLYANKCSGKSDIHTYALLAILGLLLNLVGKLYQVLRVRNNLKFCMSKGKKYTVKCCEDNFYINSLLSHINLKKPLMAYKCEIESIKNFFKNSYERDYSESKSREFFIFSISGALISSLIYFIFNRDVFKSFTFFTISLCMLIPMNITIVNNMPIYTWGKQMLRKGIAIINCFAIKQFCNVNVLEICDKDIYEQGSVTLCGVKTFCGVDLNDVLLNAVSLNACFDSLISDMLLNVIKEQPEILPKVTNPIYDANCGISGWIKGKKVLFGNKTLMDKYGVYVKKDIDENKYKNKGIKLYYCSIGGNLSAIFLVNYNANPSVSRALKKLEHSGINIVLHSNDVNITSESVEEDFELLSKCVTIVRKDNYNSKCIEQDEQNQDDNPLVYISEKFYSISELITSCSRLNWNVALCFSIQVVSIILGFFSVIMVSCYLDVFQIKETKLIIYILIWSLSIMLVAGLRKRK